jgi:hypothetical protein
MSVVNQTLMAEMAVEYALGVDILSKGQRKIEDKLGASDASGDTVNVPITDSGIVFDNLDITDLKDKLAVRRAFVPVTVKPIGTAAEASSEQLTLAIKDREIMAKRVANLQDETNRRAFEGLLAGAQVFVGDPGNNPNKAAREDAYGLALYDADAHTSASKFAGDTMAITHAQTWNRLCQAMGQTFGANGKIGNSIYKNELGPLLGHNWSKSGLTGVITGVEQGIGQFVIGGNGFDPAGVSATVTGTKDGALSQPCYLKFGSEYVQTVDALGKPTGIQKAIYFKWKVDYWANVPGYGWIPDPNQTPNGHWELAQPLFLAGPRKNAHSVAYEEYVAAGTRGLDRHGFIQPDFDWYGTQQWNRTPDGTQDPVGDGVTTFTVTDTLTAGKTYLAPMVMFHESDFLIGIKGLEKMSSHDSLTVPTDYADKGIIPWRGTFWEDPYTSLSLFRVDGLMGFGMYQGVSGASVFLPID